MMISRLFLSVASLCVLLNAALFWRTDILVTEYAFDGRNRHNHGSEDTTDVDGGVDLVKSCQDDVHGFAPVLNQVTVASAKSAAAGPKVLCFVNTVKENHETRIPAILKTWGPKCDKLVLASSETDRTIGAVQIPNTNYTYETIWGKHRETIRYIYNKYGQEYDWFFKADDDTYLIVENLKQYLGSSQIQEEHSRGIPLHIGNRVSIYVDETGVHQDGRDIKDEEILSHYLHLADFKFIFNVGGAGYAMNNVFMKNMVEWIDRKECAPSLELSTLLDDPMVSFCSANFGTFPYEYARDEHGLERFHQETPYKLLIATPGTKMHKQYQEGKKHTGGFQYGENCCSKRSISFHRLKPNEILDMHRLLYDCRTLIPKLPAIDTRKALVTAGTALTVSGKDEWPPRATTLRIGGRSRSLVIIIVNCGVVDFGDNLAQSIIQSGATNFVFVPLDLTAYNILLQTYPDNLVPPPPQAIQQNELHGDSGPIAWGTDAFKRINNMRPWILLQFLNLWQFDILYNDSDMVWRTDVMNIVQQKNANAVFVEDRPGRPDHICSCFVFLRPKRSNIQFLETWHKTVNGKKETLMDQAAFNIAVKERGKKFSYTLLYGDKDFFPTGFEYFDDWHLRKRKKAKIVHNNWISGKWRKRLRFEKHGLWEPSGNLAQVPYNCKTMEVAERQNPLAWPETKVTVRTNRPRRRTLVILLGGVRGGEATWHSLYRNLLQPNNADLAVMLGGGTKSSSLFQRAKYVWEFPDYDDWNDGFDQYFHDQADPNWKELLTTKATAASPFGSNSSGAIVGLGRAILSDRLEKLGLVDEYDWFVVTRPDQYYECALDLSILDPSKLYVPTGEDWRGICDRFLATGKKNILTALNTHAAAIKEPGKYKKFNGGSDSFLGNAEMFIKQRWEEDGIFKDVERFRRIMFTAYAEDDSTRWQADLMKTAFIEDGEKIHYKYSDEYYQAMSCKANGGPALIS